MTPEEKARAVFAYEKPGHDFRAVLRLYAIHPRLLINTPDVFLAAHIEHLDGFPVGWNVFLFAGRIDAVWPLLPRDLPALQWLMWKRSKTGVLHFTNLRHIRNLTTNHHGRRL